MSKSRSSLLALTLLLLAGAGCLGGDDGAATTPTGGMWVSEDAGDTWVAKSALPTAAGTNSINGLDILALEQDPSDSSAFYVGSKTSGLFYSLDGGDSWMRPENKMAASGGILSVEVDPRNVCTYYVLKSDRLLKTVTCGREFDVETYVETRADESLTDFSIDWYNPQNLYIGTSRGDILRSSDAGETWKSIRRIGGSIVDIELSNADSRIILVGTEEDGIYRTTDSGATWTSLEESMEKYEGSENILSFSQTADGSRWLMHSGYGLMTSDDQGVTWKRLRLVSTSSASITAAEIAPQNKDLIYYAAGGTFYTSTSAGDAWSTNSMPTTRVGSVIHVDEDDVNRVYMGVMSVEEDD